MCQEWQPPNAESVANEVTGEGDTEAQARVFYDSGLIGNPCVVMMPSPHTGHFACAAFPATIEQSIGIFIIGESVGMFARPEYCQELL